MKKFRDLHIPVDNIVQDWNYYVAAKPKEAAKPANKLANGTTAKVDMKYLCDSQWLVVVPGFWSDSG